MISRGTQGRPIFRDAVDYQYYLQVLQAAVGRDVSDLPMHAMARALGHDPGGLSLGLQRLAEEMTCDPDLQATVEWLCEALRHGRRLTTSIRHARPLIA